jgi:hypothetical protein
MSKTTEPNATNEKPISEAGTFSLRALFVLTAVFGFWLFMFSETRSEPMFVVVFWSIAIGAGVAAHLLYRYVFRWRGTVLVTLLLVPALIYFGTARYFGVASQDIIWLLTLPAVFASQQSWPALFFSTFPYIASAVILAAAHAIKPTLVNAIISAMGISIWYALAHLIAASGG